MNRLQLFLTLCRHVRMSERRSMAFGQNRAARVVMWFLGLFMVIYMLMISLCLALVANETSSVTPAEFFFSLLPFILVLDLGCRFIGQHTPSQLVKPYMLLPIPKHACVEVFILTSMASANNLMWMLITVPYAVMTMLFGYGVAPTVLFVIAFQVVVVINSQWYMAVRSLTSVSVAWWLLPAAVYGVMFAPWWWTGDIGSLLDFYSLAGTRLDSHAALFFALLAAVLAACFIDNRRMQYYFTYMESSGTSDAALKDVTQLHQLDRFGRLGEYLKLETKSIMRNKNMRRSFVIAACVTMVLGLVISFTDLYSPASLSFDFWMVYPFVLYGATMMVRIMCAEGNYIDCLMVRKENIIDLLRAKYYFHSAMLAVPAVLMLPAVISGRCTLLMLMAMMLFMAGPGYCLLMQMAVYNKQTVPLNTKFVSRGNIETNYFQVVAEMIAMFMPVVITSLLKALLGDTVAYCVMLAVGVAFIAMHKYWLRNIYRRFMARRHDNMQAFRSTR